MILLDNKKQLISEYKNELKLSYPSFYSKVLSNYNQSELIDFDLILCNLYKIRHYLKIIKIEKNKDLEELNQLILRLYLLIPLGDEYLIYYIFRSISESLIRDILFMSPGNDISKQKLNHFSFRTLKEKIKNDYFLKNKTSYFTYLYDAFGYCSKKIHNPQKNITKMDTIDISPTKSFDVGYLKSFISNINKIFLDFIIPNLLEIDLQKIQQDKKLFLLDLFSKKEKEKYFS